MLKKYKCIEFLIINNFCDNKVPTILTYIKTIKNNQGNTIKKISLVILYIFGFWTRQVLWWIFHNIVQFLAIFSESLRSPFDNTSFLLSEFAFIYIILFFLKFTLLYFNTLCARYSGWEIRSLPQSATSTKTRGTICLRL